jgi:acetyl esterase/lipase
VTVDLTVRYGDAPEHSVDLRLPTGPPGSTGSPDEPRPLVVVLHGGFWKAEWDRAHAAPQCDALARAGYVVATPEYRRVGQPGGGWPGTLDDTAAVTDVVRRLVADAVGARVDVRRTTLVGHSAGGHLAAWAVSRHRLPVGSPWYRAEPVATSVVSLAGVLDLALSERLGLGDHAAEGLLGGTSAERPDRYALADPVALLPSGVPVRIVHGTDDDTVPVEVGRAYADAARDAGDDVTLHELPGLGHQDVIEPDSPAWPAVLAAVAEVTR